MNTFLVGKEKKIFIVFWKITGNFVQLHRNIFLRSTRPFPRSYIFYDILLFLSYRLLFMRRNDNSNCVAPQHNKRRSYKLDILFDFVLGLPDPKFVNDHDEKRSYVLAIKFNSRSWPFSEQNWFSFSAWNAKILHY